MPLLPAGVAKYAAGIPLRHQIPVIEEPITCQKCPLSNDFDSDVRNRCGAQCFEERKLLAIVALVEDIPLQVPI